MMSSLRCLSAPCAILLVLTAAAGDAVPGSEEVQDADSMVQAALQAEVDGDIPRREALLAGAVEQEPEHLAARWHSGHVRIDDQWLTVEDAEYNTSQEGAVAAYRKLRNFYSGSLAGELALARWCRKHDLEQRERLHWANALRFDPSNKEARRRLGVREFQGRLLTAEQIETWKQARRDYEPASQEWSPRLKRWQREIESSPSPSQTGVWHQLTSLDDARAVPSLEQMFRKAEFELQLLIVDVLGNIEEQVATDALVRLSIYADSSEIRRAAATKLSDRSWFGFVPNLLGRLETPVEYQYYVNTLGTGVYGEVRYSQEHPSAVVSKSHSINAQFPIRVRPNATKFGVLNAITEQREAVAREASRQYRRMLESLHAVQVKNAQKRRFNERVYAALETSTCQQIEHRPKYWWDWWQEYNEHEEIEEKPEYELRHTQNYQRLIHTVSCFAAGTLVWTETGPVSIEDVCPGDRVLSQDPDSGQLAYRMVLETTIRPPSPTLRIQVADEQIEATLGHPLWVVGKGWRMAKELKAGDQLHSVQGGITIDNIEPGPTLEAYNLVVDETNTYFVGKHRLLVHDNMPRQAEDLPVPGWSAEYH